MVAVRVEEEALVLGFDPVVELLGEPLAKLLHERRRIETGEHHPERAEEQVGVVEVGADRVVDPRVLHLHRDRAARRG